MTGREQLLFAIAYALKLKAKMPTRRKDAPPLEVGDYTRVAETVVAHLEEAGYTVTRKPYTGAGPGLHSNTPGQFRTD